MKTFEGNVVAKNVKIAIVAARFNEFIVSKLIGGAEDALLRHGVKDDDITLAWVPGAFEIPVIAKKMAESGKYDAVLCLGASSAATLPTMTMSVPKSPRASRRSNWPPASRPSSASSPPTTSSRPSSAPAPSPATRATMLRALPLKW